MNFLPIVRRELQVAAALTGLVIGSGCLIISELKCIGSAKVGSALFLVLTWICLTAGLSTGLFFTSDCLSEEKREGTLGLLFLTNLKGYDVVLGKLLSTSLRAFYALVAVLPVLAITQLMGGITGAQYARCSLALVNALVFSLAAGMVISMASRDSQKALGGTLLVLLLFTIGGPIGDAMVASAKNRGFQPFWSLSSPAYVLSIASAWGRSLFWESLLATQMLAWCFWF